MLSRVVSRNCSFNILSILNYKPSVSKQSFVLIFLLVLFPSLFLLTLFDGPKFNSCIINTDSRKPSFEFPKKRSDSEALISSYGTRNIFSSSPLISGLILPVTSQSVSIAMSQMKLYSKSQCVSLEIFFPFSKI